MRIGSRVWSIPILIMGFVGLLAWAHLCDAIHMPLWVRFSWDWVYGGCIGFIATSPAKKDEI